MKVILDDTGLYVTALEGKRHVGEIRFDWSAEFNDFVESILSASQWRDYVGNDTRRTFSLSKKSAAIVNEKLS